MDPLQQIVEIRSVCNSAAYKYVIDILERELRDEIEGKMMKQDTLSGSVHGEWKMMRKVIARLRGIGTEYEEKWVSYVATNPDVMGHLSAGRIPESPSE